MVKDKLSPGIPLLVQSTSVHQYGTGNKQGLDGTTRESLLLIQVARELLRRLHGLCPHRLLSIHGSTIQTMQYRGIPVHLLQLVAPAQTPELFCPRLGNMLWKEINWFIASRAMETMKQSWFPKPAASGEGLLVTAYHGGNRRIRTFPCLRERGMNSL